MFIIAIRVNRKQHMTLSIGIWYISCVNSVKRKTFYSITNQAIRINAMSCGHKFEDAGIHAMAIINFFFILIILNYALIFVINHEALNIAKFEMKCY